MKKRGEILCIIVILRGTKMEIDNWQTMMLIFEVVCRIFKNKEENMERFIRKLFGLTFSALLIVGKRSIVSTH